MPLELDRLDNTPAAVSETAASLPNASEATVVKPETATSTPGPTTPEIVIPDGPSEESIEALLPLDAKKIFAVYDSIETLDWEKTEKINDAFEPYFTAGVFYENWVSIFSRTDFLLARDPFLGYSAGLKLGYQFKKHWRLQTGVGWANISVMHSTNSQLNYREEGLVEGPEGALFNDYSFNVLNLWGRGRYRASIGFFQQDNPELNPRDGDPFNLQIKEQDRLTYLYLPLHLQYRSSGKKWSWNAGAGIDYYTLVRSRVLYQLSGQFREQENMLIRGFLPATNEAHSPTADFGALQPTGVKTVFVGGRLMGGIQYAIQNRWELQAQGIYHFGIRNISELNKIRYVGFQLGATYRFQKLKR